MGATRKLGGFLAAAFVVVTIALSPGQAQTKQMQSDQEIDAHLFEDLDGVPGSGQLRRLLAQVEPERWDLLRETVRRAFDTRDDDRRTALIRRVAEIEGAARVRAYARVAEAPIAALDALDRAAIAMLRDLARRDPAVCAAWRWSDQAPPDKRVEAQPRSLLLPVEIETLRAALAGRTTPTGHRQLDREMAARLRQHSQEAGFSEAEIAANEAAERPAGWSDADLCALLIRMKEADRGLPDELRAALLINDYPAAVDDASGAHAERLARIPAMPDAEIDAMMLADRSDVPGAGPALALLLEDAPDAALRLRRIVRESFRPVDDGEVARFSATTALSLAIVGTARVAEAPAGSLDELGRAVVDASVALGRKSPDLCGRPGRPWHGGGEPSEIVEAIPSEAARFARETALALRAAQRSPVKRRLDDPIQDEAVGKALEATGYRPPDADARPGDRIQRPTDQEGGYCRWHADYLAALLRLPDGLRAHGLASYLSHHER